MCANDARAQCVHFCKTGRSFRVTFHCCVFFLCILQKTWLGFTWLNMNSSSCYLSTGYEVWSSSWHNIKCIPFLTQAEVQRPKVAYSFYPCKTLFHLRRSYDTMISLSKSFLQAVAHCPTLFISHIYIDVSRMVLRSVRCDCNEAYNVRTFLDTKH